MGAEQRSGFVVWRRRIFDSWLWALPASQFKVVFALVAFANWQPEQWHDGVAPVAIERGEFITSQGKLAKACGVSIKVVRVTLAKLERGGMIEIVAGRASNFTRIRLIDYDTSQDISEDGGELGASWGRAKGERRATSKPVNQGTNEEDRQNSQSSPQGELFVDDATPAPLTGSHTAAVARRVLDYLNTKASRRLTPAPYYDLVRRVLADGHTEKELKLVVWWAAEHEWPAGHENHGRVHPSTLFPMTKPNAARTFPQYLDVARETFEKVNGYEFNPLPKEDQQ